MDELGNNIDFAGSAAASWDTKENGKVPANKSRKEAVYLEYNLVSTEAIIRKEGRAKFEGLKMKARLESKTW